MENKEYFSIGKITKTKGLKGELQLYLDVENPQDYIELESVFIEIHNKPVPFFIEKISIQKNIAYLVLEGLSHIDEAQKLINKTVYIFQKNIPENTNDSIPNDLKGFYVIDERLGELGKINEIQIFPSQYIASITYKEKEVLFPLNDAFIKSINTEKAELYVELPEGLIDIYLS